MPFPSVVPAPQGIDNGEFEAIELADQLHAHILIIDDLAGREEAERRGLKIVGTLGILRDAHLSGILDIQRAVGRLKETTFRASPAMLDRLLR